MKKLSLLNFGLPITIIVVLITVILAGCSKTNNNPPPASSEYVVFASNTLGCTVLIRPMTRP